MKSLLISVVLLPAVVFAQSPIPSGTVLPLQLSTSVNSQRTKPGQTITARVMQDVPLQARKKIPAGARVVGHVVNAEPANNGQPAQITLRFDRLDFDHQSLAVNTSLRALASMVEVEYAQVPPTGPDRGTPWAWTTRNLIGGEVAYGQGGPVARGTNIVGLALADGVLVPLHESGRTGCQDEIDQNAKPQALWVFSSDACGVYGFKETKLTHAGRTTPLGQITLTSTKRNLKIPAGSGLLLRVIDSDLR